MWLNIGLCGGTFETVKLFESYLSDRRQCVKVNGLKSSIMPSQTGRASGISCRADIRELKNHDDDFVDDDRK